MRAVAVHIAAAVGAAALGVVAAGCRAEPKMPPAVDMAQLLDLGAGVQDSGDMNVCKPDRSHPEVCDNLCDDDGNGFIDQDDPACTPQLLVTPASASKGPVQRMIVSTGGAQPMLKPLVQKPTTPSPMATLDYRLSPLLYMARDGTGHEIDTLAPDGSTYYSNTTFQQSEARDVCAFNNELIVIEPYVTTDLGGRLHRFTVDAKTELMPSVLVAGHLSACTSDGTVLYVSRYAPPNASEIVTFAKGSATTGPVPMGNPIPMPAAARADKTCCPSGTNCCDRLVDFAWIEQTKSFIGLFASGGLLGATLDHDIDSPYLAEFGLDGSVTLPWLPTGTGPVHGVGSFVP